MNLCQGPAFPHRCTWSPERRSQVLKENFKTHNTVCPLVPLGSSEITRCRKHNREIWVLPLESVPCLSFPGASPHLCQLFPGLQTFISYKGERSPAWPDAGEKLHYPVCTERATSQERGRSGPVGRGGISGVARRKRYGVGRDSSTVALSSRLPVVRSRAERRGGPTCASAGSGWGR